MDKREEKRENGGGCCWKKKGSIVGIGADAGGERFLRKFKLLRGLLLEKKAHWEGKRGAGVHGVAPETDAGGFALEAWGSYGGHGHWGKVNQKEGGKGLGNNNRGEKGDVNCF